MCFHPSSCRMYFSHVDIVVKILPYILFWVYSFFFPSSSSSWLYNKILAIAAPWPHVLFFYRNFLFNSQILSFFFELYCFMTSRQLRRTGSNQFFSSITIHHYFFFVLHTFSRLILCTCFPFVHIVSTVHSIFNFFIIWRIYHRTIRRITVETFSFQFLIVIQHFSTYCTL